MKLTEGKDSKKWSFVFLVCWLLDEDWISGTKGDLYKEYLLTTYHLPSHLLLIDCKLLMLFGRVFPSRRCRCWLLTVSLLCFNSGTKDPRAGFGNPSENRVSHQQVLLALESHHVHCSKSEAFPGILSSSRQIRRLSTYFKFIPGYWVVCSHAQPSRHCQKSKVPTWTASKT